MSALLQVVLHHILEEYFFSNIHHTMDQELNPSSSMTGQLGFVPNLQTEELARTPLFQKLTAGLPEDEQVDLAYARCRAIMKAYSKLMMLLGYYSNTHLDHRPHRHRYFHFITSLLAIPL
jgi:hypothetical protein